jgi:aminoglycoside phosphotransferase family enzyme/predicted kinase
VDDQPTVPVSDPQEEAAAWLAAKSERVVETALARVFLGREAVFKQKRPVSFGYVDFSTSEKRLWALERELVFNRPGAPELYVGLRRITRSEAGGLEFDGPGELVDQVLEMRRFADEALLSANPGLMDGAMAEALGRTIADFHAAAPKREHAGLSFTVPSNAELIDELAADLGEGLAKSVVGETEAEYLRQRPLLDARIAAGFSRRCHGDLHLGNIIVRDGRPMLFDCIEFNDTLSDIDVFYDLAFLLMDLGFRGRRDLAVRALGGYLDQAARRFPDTLWDGLAALPLFQAVRAGVRAHVSAHGGDLELARRYLAAAREHLAPAPPRLLAVGGRSGSGKSSVAREIAPQAGAAPGAVILRSDEIRKRLAGLAPTEHAPAEAYSPAFDARVFEEMFGLAARLLGAGRTVLLDATFLRPELRARAETVARAADAAFDGLWLEAPAETLRARVAARSGDASDADVAVLEAQLGRDPGAMSWTRLDARPPAREAARRWLER